MSRFYLPTKTSCSVISRDSYEPEVKKEFRLRNKDLIEVLTRGIPKSKNEGNIQMLVIGVEGPMRSGKSVFTMQMSEIMEKHYGEKFNPIYYKCEPFVKNDLVFASVDSKLTMAPVQFIVFDDALFLSTKKSEETKLINYVANFAHGWEKQCPNVEVGLVVIFFLYQVRYKLTAQLRAIFNMFVSFGVVLERWYLQDDLAASGTDAVKMRFKNEIKKLKGDYGSIGHGTIIMPCDSTGDKFITSGEIYFKLPKDFNQDLDNWFNVVDPYEAGSSTSAFKLAAAPVTDIEAFSGIAGHIVTEFYIAGLEAEYYDGIFIDGDNKWKNAKKTRDKEQITERLTSHVQREFLHWSHKDVLDFTIAGRVERHSMLSHKITERTNRDYYANLDKFFSYKSKFIGETIETYCRNKLQYAIIEEGLSLTVHHNLNGADLFLFQDKTALMPINVKFSSTHTSGCYPTPEDKLALKHKIKYGVLVVDTENYPKLKFQAYEPKKETVGQKHTKPLKEYLDWSQIMRAIIQSSPSF